MSAEITEFPRTKVVETDKDSAAVAEATIKMLTHACEEMGRGMKMMTSVIAEQDRRIRRLELGLHKLQRKNTTPMTALNTTLTSRTAPA